MNELGIQHTTHFNPPRPLQNVAIAAFKHKT